MRLRWHQYTFLPYERELGLRELGRLAPGIQVTEATAGIDLGAPIARNEFDRLTYFADAIRGQTVVRTVQGRLEDTAKSARGRQATRYSVHGLHEYKGKFNPQVARAILNMLRISGQDRVIDPFCGSGTSLVECAHLGIDSVGVDMNPFAVFVANAKLLALSARRDDLRNALDRTRRLVASRRCWGGVVPVGARGSYLQSWFDPNILSTIEILRDIIRDSADVYAPVLLCVLSDFLRAYSRQDPGDLRIRRRKTAIPVEPLPVAFVRSATSLFRRIWSAQEILSGRVGRGSAILCDVRTISSRFRRNSFDCAITSPPYAMALPYIDTQRLSLVWLDLVPPEGLMRLEADLVGSREVRGSGKGSLLERMLENQACLPEQETEFCLQLYRSVGMEDGFRRRAVPILLYRYFSAMRDSFRKMIDVMRPNAPYALIVGHNHTVLGGTRFEIETPCHLSSLAQSTGWTVEETIPLQTYRRYGYHANNAVTAETLLFLRAA